MQEGPGVAPDARRERRDISERDGERDGERKADGSPSGLSIEDLAEATNLPIRTIRYYISKGLLPGPGSRGRQATYGAEQLARLRLIRLLAERHVPLARMRELLAPLTLEDVHALLADEERRAAELQWAEQAASPREQVTGLLQHAQAMYEGPAAPSVSENAKRFPPWGSPEAAATSGPLRTSPRRPLTSQASLAETSAALPAPAEAWQRWELAPGFELHVRADAERRHRALIRRMLAAAYDGEQDGQDER